MKVLGFISPDAENAGEVQKALETVVAREHIETLSSIASLKQHLQQPLSNPRPIMLLAPSGGDFSLLPQLLERLKSFDIILVLPDEEPRTITMGHALQPRLLGHGTPFLRLFPPILERMLQLRAECPAKLGQKDAQPPLKQAALASGKLSNNA
jgi:hypothetical protein